MGRLGKRGDALILPEVIFIILTVVLAGALAVFIWNASTGAIVFEEPYTKKIANVLDRARPGSTVLINMDEPLALFAENVFDEDDFRNVMGRPEVSNVVKIDNAEKTITVNLKNKGGNRVNYFSDYFFESSFRGDGVLIIKVSEEENV